MKRLFFAFRIPKEARRPLELFQEHLPQVGCRVSMVSDFHVTFKFLGEVFASKELEIILNAQAVIRRAALSPDMLEVQFSKPGLFEFNGQPSTVFVTVKLQEALYQFQKDLEYALEPLGFGVEKRRFKPHATVARLREFKAAFRAPWLEVFKGLGVQRAPFSISELELIETRLSPDGSPVYETVERFSF